MRLSAVSAILLTIHLATAAAAGFDCCFVDDPSQTRCFVSPIRSNEELTGGVCGHTITGSNCLLQIRTDVTVFEGPPGGSNCLTIGPGVAVDMENHTFRCDPRAGTGTASRQPRSATAVASPLVCGSAFVIAGSGRSTQRVSIQNGRFTGCWGNGAIKRSSSGGTNNAVENVAVDGAMVGDCGAPGKGIDDIAAVSDTLIKNTSDFAVRMNLPGATLEDSIIRNSAIGIKSNDSGGQTIDNVLLIDDGTAIDKTAATLSRINTRSSVIRASTVCNCVRAGVCDPTCSQGPLAHLHRRVDVHRR